MGGGCVNHSQSMACTASFSGPIQRKKMRPSYLCPLPTTPSLPPSPPPPHPTYRGLEGEGPAPASDGAPCPGNTMSLEKEKPWGRKEGEHMRHMPWHSAQTCLSLSVILTSAFLYSIILILFLICLIVYSHVSYVSVPHEGRKSLCTHMSGGGRSMRARTDSETGTGSEQFQDLHSRHLHLWEEFLVFSLVYALHFCHCLGEKMRLAWQAWAWLAAAWCGWREA